MRKLIRAFSLFLLLLTVMLAAGGCRRQERARLEVTEEEPPALASVVHVADPATAAQLLKGFHEIEQGSWRWTAGGFSVMLLPPARAAQLGARLQLKFSVPGVVIERLKSVTLKATAGSTALPPETYSKPGEHVYAQDVPAAALGGSSVAVDFMLDQTFAPGGGDERQLGIIVTTVGLEPK
ncbi:MAG: hypothetical protein FJW34_04315 [Acidobacteria bacterium]|nr:hypothetical protein [Acidobacteriota bacterium]